MPYLGLKGNGLLVGITCSAGMGFILFGYDDGVIGGLLTSPSFESQFGLSSSMQGTVTSIFMIGCFVGCISTALFNGRWGRKTVAHLGSFVLSAGATLQATSFEVAQLIVGRIVAGIGLGLIVSNVIVWQAEVTPSKIRGLAVASALSFLIVGQLLAYWIDYAMMNDKTSVSWRFPFAFQAALGMLTSAMLVFMPESPRWLLQHEYREQALEVIRLLSTHKDALNEDYFNKTVSEITEAIAIENQQASWKDLWKGDEVGSRRRVLLACLINACQAWSGSTPVSYYTTVIFQESVGLSYHMALLMSGFLQVWFLISSFGTWYTIEKWGRRMSFMVTALAMTVIMAILASMVAINTTTSGIVAAIMIFLYQTAYTLGFMGGIWVYGPEIMPLAHRAKGEGLATACLWLSSFVVVQIVPVCIANIGWRTYIIFVVCNLAFVPMVYFLFPETAGFTLESVDLCFMDKSVSPVKKANELWRAMKRGEDVNLGQSLMENKGQEVTHVEAMGA